MIRSAASSLVRSLSTPPREAAPVAQTPTPAMARGFDAAGFGRDSFEAGVRPVDYRVLSPLGHVTAPDPVIAGQWARNAGNAVVISPSGSRTVFGQGYSPGR